MRKGRQTPTDAYILPYNKTRGDEAIKLYNSTGRTAQEWQEGLINDLLAINDDDLYVHMKYGYSVPRRNGKNEVVTIREMWGLVNGEKIMHTAHRTTTTHTAWERLFDLLEKANIKITSSYRAYGKEHIQVEDGGRIEFRTRTSKGGLGEGFDLLIIDEAQEYQDDQESALKYVVSDAMNPQTIFCGTPPTPSSAGAVFMRYRDDTLQGKNADSGWAEWSVSNKCDPKDKENWYMTNPSLGTILTERKITAEIGSDEMDFNIQRLGLWVKYALNSVIQESDWKKLKIDALPTFQHSLFVGVRYGVDNTNVSMSIAVKTTDGRIFIEAIDCRPVRNGNKWIIDFLCQASKVASVVIDGANGQTALEEAMKAEGLKKPILPTVKEIITANSNFERAVFDGTICHNDQPSLTAIATACEHRAIGTAGGFGYKSLKDTNDICLLESAILAFWGCSVYRERRKQKISY